MLVKTSFLNTFETPLGRYRFSRMLFGIAQATKQENGGSNYKVGKKINHDDYLSNTQTIRSQLKARC